MRLIGWTPERMIFMADIGIDLGTASVLIYIKGQGIVLHEPSAIIIEKNTSAIWAVGDKVYNSFVCRTNKAIVMHRLRQWVISDYEIIEKVLKYFINKTAGRPLLRKPRIAVCVPSSVTEVERRAVEDATKQAGARQVYVIETPIAAAIGAGLDIAKACSSMNSRYWRRDYEYSRSLPGNVHCKHLSECSWR